ncbi:acyl-CoA thioesterase [Niveispirillum fermenti]|uniref:acyl-CoA thioesterase n=1 Tax=Niveispirillum fermenti TaxID=1233113 RepID=UPI003A89F1A7
MPVIGTMTEKQPAQAGTLLMETVLAGGTDGRDDLLSGGDALRLMGWAAQVAAGRHTNGRVMMMAADEVRFHRPVPIGHRLELMARLVHMRGTMMTILVDGMMQPPAGGPRALVLSGYFQMLAIDDAERPRHDHSAM